jgi:non-ribosomal peptide synthetase component F
MAYLPLEEQTLLSQFGRGPAIAVPHSLIHEAIEAVVEGHANAIAAKHDGKALTYQQLDTAANRLAHYLIQSGLKPRQRVCLVVHRSFEMLIGLLAILKAGCQYVPIDGGVASEQALKHIFTDSDARFILCLPNFWDKIRHFTRNDAMILALTLDTGAFYPSTKPSVQVLPQDGAYAIYTSGTHINRANGHILRTG